MSFRRSLDWRRQFEVYDPRLFSEEEFRHTVSNTLMDHPDPGTAQYVAVQAQTMLQELLESQLISAHEKDDAEKRVKEFLLYHPVVQNYQYKQAFRVLSENLTMAQESDQNILKRIHKVRIVLETAIRVTLSNVSSPPEEDPNSSGDEEDVFDEESQIARRNRYDIHLYGPYLNLVRGLRNMYNVPRW